MSKSIYNISGGALALNAGTACTTAVPAGAECGPAETAGAGCHLAEAAAGPACAPCGFRVSVGYATAAAEEISGDTAISSGLSDGSLALILSDGMGKGIRAAALSRAATSRLRKNLKGGMAPAHAIKEVNTFMVSHAKAENFATLDLLIIDRNTRKAKFYKMGAASSFVLRDGKVRMFEQAALPIGIIPEIRLTHVALQLRPGDIVLMVSDGITEPAGTCQPRALEPTLKLKLPQNPEPKPGPTLRLAPPWTPPSTTILTAASTALGCVNCWRNALRRNSQAFLHASWPDGYLPRP